MKGKYLSLFLSASMTMNGVPVFIQAEETDPMQQVMAASTDKKCESLFSSMGFHWNDPNVLDSNGYKPDGNNIMWINGSQAYPLKNRQNLQVTITPKDSNPAEPVTLASKDIQFGWYGKSAYWEMEKYLPEQGGSFTLRVECSEGYKEQDFQLVKLNFKEKGDNTDCPDSILFFVGDTYPKLPVLKDGQEAFQFLGWSRNQKPADEEVDSITTSSQPLFNGINEVPDGNYTLDLYPVYGIRNVKSFKIVKAWDGSQEAFPEKSEYEFSLDKSVHYGQSAVPLTFYIVNTGNMTLGSTNNGGKEEGFYVSSTAHFNVKIEPGKPEEELKSNSNGTVILEAGGNKGKIPVPADANYLKVVCTLKPGLNVGIYKDDLYLGNDMRSIEHIFISASIVKGSISLSIPEVEKSYGQSVSIDEQGYLLTGSQKSEKPIEISGADSLSWKDLNIRLDNAGFADNASVKEDGYEYSIASSNPDYEISIADKSVLKIKPAIPEGAAGVTASSVKAGEKLSASTLSYAFVNPYKNDLSVPGTIEWTDDQNKVVSTTPNEQGIAHTWKFTPEDQTNYSEVTGTTKVVVTEKTPTEIHEDLSSLKDNVVYDGNEHRLSFYVTESGKQEKLDETAQSKLTTTYRRHSGSNEEDNREEFKPGWPSEAGTWDIKAVYEDPDSSFARAEKITHLTIEPKDIGLSFSKVEKIYDGTDEAKVEITPTGLIQADQGKVTIKKDSYKARFDSKEAGENKPITITGLELDGDKAGNYKLPINQESHASGTIKPKSLTLSAIENAILSKIYGQETVIDKTQFTSEDFVEGESISNLEIEFDCAGIQALADAGEYPITASLGKGNYVLTDSKVGDYTVEKSTLKVLTPPSASAGKKGGSKSAISIQPGTVVNEVNEKQIVPGTWSLTDTSGNFPYAESDQMQWKFIPESKAGANYTQTELTGSVEVKLLDKEPVKIETDYPSEITYDGNEHPLKASQVKTSPKEADVLISYGSDTGSTAAPKDAGEYAITIRAIPDDTEKYSESEITLHLTIKQADLTPVIPALSDIEGIKLSDLDIKAIRFNDINGQKVEGEFSWDNSENIISQPSEKFNWTFRHEDKNYVSPVSGLAEVLMKEDTRKVKIEGIYNLPNDLGLQDYVKVDFEGLRSGDRFALYLDEKGEKPVSNEVLVTSPEEKAEVFLDGSILNPDGGSLYCKINGIMSKAYEVKYPAQIGFRLSPEEVLLHTAKTEGEMVQAIASDSSYVMKAHAWSLASDGEEFASLEMQDKPGSVLLKGKTVGSSFMNAAITFAHPDPAKAGDDYNITLSKTIPFTVTDQFAISIVQVEGGSALADKTQAAKGDLVHITLKADSSYTASSLTVQEIDSQGKVIKEVEVDKVSSSEYSFTMPANNVLITPSFNKSSNTGGGYTPGGGSSSSQTPSLDQDKPEDSDKPSQDQDGETDKDKDIVDSSTTTDPEGNTTTTTEYKDGTIEEKIEKVDGSTETTTTRTDGSVEKVEESADKNTVVTTNKEPDGSLSVVTENKTADGKSTINGSVALTEKSISYAKSSGKNVTIRMPEIPADHTGNDVQLTVSIPESVDSATLEIPVDSETIEPGSVAMIENEKGELVPIVNSIGKDGKLIVPLSKSQKIIIKDNKLSFADVTTPTSDYPANGIAFLSARRLMTGVGDGTNFDLTGKVTRAQLATILYRYNGSPDVAGLALPEGADPTGYYANAAKWAGANKLMAVGSNFNAADLLTREQLAMILWRMEGNPDPGTINLSTYQDANSISTSEMQKAVGWAVNTGLMGKGTPKLNASGSSQRQELAAMLSRYLTH